MDKNAIKKYAVWARRELIERVSQRALIYGISAEDAGDPNADNVNGHLLSQVEKRQRQALIAQIREKGFQQVMEEVAYTWFNRFAALRFMEVNGYLPSHIRVFTNDAGEFKPQILAEAIHLELDGLDMNRVYELENANKNEELFKYLLIVQCNALNSILPGMFQKIEDYTELLLPDNLLREGSVIEQMVTMIPEEDWTDQVQIIGWLYQYYNTEPKDKVFADLKKNIKISKENIPAATQLFTPDWIVHYMVENSLGRLWLEGHPESKSKMLPTPEEQEAYIAGNREKDDLKWHYYVEEAEQEPEVEAQLAEIRKEYAALKPEEIRVIDPCMGSGHILCVLFDVLISIYEEYGYTAREAAVKIVENNLWGLDIDERAAQLSYFAVMMKARQYDRRFFTRNIQPHVYAIEESNGITSAHDMGLNLTQEEYGEAVKQAMRLVEEMHDAKEYGSIIHVTPCDWDLLRRFAVPRDEDGQMRLDVHGEIEASERLQVLINIGETLAQKYHAVVTNPPYMNNGGMSQKLSEYVKEQFPNSKSDLFSVFIEQCGKMLSKTGFQAMITQHAWMFLGTFEKLRSELLKRDIINMVHLGARAFEEIGGEVVQTTSFVVKNNHTRGYKSTYCRLIEPNTQQGKEDLFLKDECRFTAKQDTFCNIPESPIAYWLSPNTLSALSGTLASDFARFCKGMDTGDNNRFLRLWSEVDHTKINYPLKWVPYNKGGSFRKWYGNNDYVLNWDHDGSEVTNFKGSNIRNKSFYLKPGITWSATSSGSFACRYCIGGFIFDSKGCMAFSDSKEQDYYLMAAMNTKPFSEFMKVVSPTLDYNPGPVGRGAVKDCADKSTIVTLVEHCIDLSIEDWDSFETSWDFKEHPFLTSARWAAKNGVAITIRQAFEDWARVAEDRFRKLKENEEELNRIFIDIYGLGDELSPEVEDKDVTVRKADWQRDVRSFISYAVGCMFGRYTLGKPGLIYAGGEWDASKYTKYQPDKDAIIPICDDEYFEDDILGQFVSFVEKAFGKEALEENLRFIADALGGKGSSRDVIRNYFINDFYEDHLKVYQKRPIYWLFESGKKNGFKCLIYMHRYQPDTIARIRTDYVHEQQSRYRTAIADLETRIANAGTSERVKLTKQLTKIQEQAEELRVYEEKIHHLADQMIRIDLDDGVKVNYAKFQDVLAKIK